MEETEKTIYNNVYIQTHAYSMIISAFLLNCLRWRWIYTIYIIYIGIYHHISFLLLHCANTILHAHTHIYICICTCIQMLLFFDRCTNIWNSLIFLCFALRRLRCTFSPEDSANLKAERAELRLRQAFFWCGDVALLIGIIQSPSPVIPVIRGLSNGITGIRLFN